MDRFAYQSAAGVIYVDVLGAAMNGQHEEPTLRVTSGLTWSHEPTDGEHVTLRGRKYHIDRVYRFGNFGGGQRWTLDRSYNSWRGFLNDDRSEVSSVIASKLEALASEARTAFAEAYPDWARPSSRLRLAYEHGQAASKAQKLREELKGLEQTMSKLETQLAALEECGMCSPGHADTTSGLCKRHGKLIRTAATA